MAKPTITKRTTKGAALTYAELDSNFENLQNATFTITGGSTAVTADLNGTITLVAGTNVTITGNDTSKEITISATSGGGGGSMSGFTVSGDTGTAQNITDANNLTISGGTGLSSVASATDTITINLDNTAVTAGSYTNASITVDAQGRITSASSGTAPVTSITAGTGISVTGTTTPTVAIANTAVTAGSYTYASITVDAQGRITSASSGTTPVTSPLSSDLTLGSYKIIDTNSVATIQSTQGLMIKSDAYANAELTIIPGDISNALSRISTKEGDLTINTYSAGTVKSMITLSKDGSYISLSGDTGCYIGFLDGITQHNGITTTARNALTPSNGMMIYNSSTNKFQGYANGAWVDLH